MESMLQTISVFVGVVALVTGVVNSVITNRKTVQSQNIQLFLAISESFRVRWEGSWSEILDEMDASHLVLHTQPLTEKRRREVYYMLNWIDWLGAMHASNSINDLSIITSSIGVSIRRIINAGYKILEDDTIAYGGNYWANVFHVANYLQMEDINKLHKDGSK